jgi:hypothetical protein
MIDIANPVTQWALIILLSVLVGTALLISVAFIRRWQQLRYARFVHTLQRQYRPIVAKLLCGVQSPSAIATLRELPLVEVELLLDPLFSKRKLPERCLAFLQALCLELGLIDLWQRRVANGTSSASPRSGSAARGDFRGRAGRGYLLRAKSIRNLGKLRHRPSWPLLVKALDDRHPDIQLVALRSLASLGAPDSFPALRDRLHAVVEGACSCPPRLALSCALASFDLSCLPALLPSLRHSNRQIRLHAAEILRAMICREADRPPGRAITQEILTPRVVEVLLSELAVDTSSAIRACAAKAIVLLADLRAMPVLRNLLIDYRWFVRLVTLQALRQLRQANTPLHQDICECLRDFHWQVREAAVETLISFGPESQRQLFEYFLSCTDRMTRVQIIEVIERTGLISTLIEEYNAGKNGSDALMIKQLAGAEGSGILRRLSPEIRQQFLGRIAPSLESSIEAKSRFLKEGQPEVESTTSLKQDHEWPTHLAA